MTIRRSILMIYLTVSVVLLGLGLTTFRMFRNQSSLVSSWQVRYQSYVAANELRQSSDELTRMARTYVCTGDSKYEDAYWHILDVRNGKSPRPDGRTIALRTIMEDLGFTNEEFGKLKLAEDNSNALVRTEKIAMHAVKGQFEDGTGTFTRTGAPDLELARRIMFDDKYHADKSSIMTPIDECIALVDARTARDVTAHGVTSTACLWTIAGLLVMLIGIAAFSHRSIQRDIVSPIGQLVKEIHLVGNGDLTRNIRIHAKNEIADLSQAINQTTDNVRAIVHQIGLTAAEMEIASKQQATGAVSQATAIAEMSATASELLASARQMTENGTGASEQAELAAKECADGTRNIQEAVQSIGDIHERVETIAQHMLGLSSKSQQISGVLDIINELSEQTNLLSLNASIEAAGAGDAGKRFAVVASEIRKLAERAAESTREIRSLIEGIQGTVNTTIMATEEGTKAAQEGVRQTGELEGFFARIASQVASAAQSAKAIEMASRQQARAIEQVDEAMRSIDAAATRSEATAQHVRTETQALAKAAGRFRTAN